MMTAGHLRKLMEFISDDSEILLSVNEGIVKVESATVLSRAGDYDYLGLEGADSQHAVLIEAADA